MQSFDIDDVFHPVGPGVKLNSIGKLVNHTKQ